MIFQAIRFATEKHEGQYRKGSKIPYIIHPLRVAQILIEHGCDDTLVAAGVLHDVVEDTPVTLEMIGYRFGSAVRDLVAECSEKDKSKPWEERKKAKLEFLKTEASPDGLLVACADKLDNVRSILHDLDREGDAVWARFKRGREKQLRRYAALTRVFEKRLTESPGREMSQKLSEAVANLRKHSPRRF